MTEVPVIRMLLPLHPVPTAVREHFRPLGRPLVGALHSALTHRTAPPE
ncbi:hypothetical protein N566_18135 [Streptomycetaceae bacterium MP113-05]|nr:hypothetical protein N566_18135 [Streptomycetaceae bacterium MP113-05]